MGVGVESCRGSGQCVCGESWVLIAKIGLTGFVLSLVVFEDFPGVKFGAWREERKGRKIVRCARMLRWGEGVVVAFVVEGEGGGVLVECNVRGIRRSCCMSGISGVGGGGGASRVEWVTVRGLGAVKE